MHAESPAATSARDRLTLGLGFFLLVALPFLRQTDWFSNYTNDDAFITLRYAWRLAHGQGLIYNLGEHVEGYTSLLHALLAALVILVRGTVHAYAGVKFLAVSCGFAAIAFAVLLFRELFTNTKSALSPTSVRAGSLLAGGLAAMSPAFAINSTSGLETSLYAGLLMLALWLGVREMRAPTRVPGSAVTFALLILTRPEAPLLFAVYWIAAAALAALCRNARLRHLVRDGVIVTAAFIALLAWRHHYYGEWLPNTYYAKSGGFWASAWPYITRGILPPLLGLGGLAAALIGFALARRNAPPRLLPVAAVALTGALLPLITGTDWMIGYRFIVPYLPAAAVTVACGWILLLQRLGLRQSVLLHLTVFALLTFAWVQQQPLRSRFWNIVNMRARGYETGHLQVASYLRGHAKPGDTVALMDIGIIGYTCEQQRILDITGLTDRHIAKSPGNFLQKQYDVSYVLDQHPEYIVLTLTAPGRAYTTPPPGTQFAFWTRTELQISRHPDFIRDYARPRAPSADPAATWLDSLAAELGAAHVYEHAHPGVYYLLAIYPRKLER